eukprot:Plantae.Rhodophyta-Purpureofilum_apyrenoidigerum.ctg20944.p1 GENE.Plantae.Rhodophyta-Purpureofilum_apyrenoidigerum.ctg20944~~Plantae.Rhodophyta-Purpureofilum_apyrenoidigerum.ctg20944.p1  ORF type:complete len:424 (-),score=64.33 Plantae.Rhodophyta-Purpureofilum_apyrenoidigerum.ctg20944:247-1518(-)
MLWRLGAGVAGFGGVAYAAWRQKTWAEGFATEKGDERLQLGGEMELMMVHVICRHGARTPLGTMLGGSDCGTNWALCDPKTKKELQAEVSIVGVNGDPPGHVHNMDATKEPLRGGCMPGELTELGCRQMRELGEKLREAYIDNFKLLSDGFNDREVHVRASYQERAVQSAQALLSGLFPKGQRPEKIPIHVMPMKKETIIPNTNQCPRLRKMFGEAKKAWRANDETEEIRAHVGLILGEDLNTPIIHFYDSFVGRYAHGLELPEGVSPKLIDEVSRLAVWEVAQLFKDRHALKLSIAPLWQEICSSHRQSLSGEEKDRKLIIYSGHDTTLMPMLESLGVFDGKWPSFAASIIVELLKEKESDRAHVRVLYNHEPVTIPGCGEKVLCEYDRFLEVLGDTASKLQTEDCADDEKIPDVRVGAAFN